MPLQSLLLASINQGASIGQAPAIPMKDLRKGQFKDEKGLFGNKV
jgi:hypothetical protein